MRRLDRIKIVVVVLALLGVVLHVHHLRQFLAAPAPPAPLHSPPPPLSSPPPPPIPPSPMLSPPVELEPASKEDRCFTRPHTEYDGDVVVWGAHNVVETAAACCATCRESKKQKGKDGCQLWVWCGDRGGCAGQKFGECWGKKLSVWEELGGVHLPKVRGKGETVPWVSGGVFSASEAAAMRAAEQAAARAVVERRERAGNPRVWMKVQIKYNSEAEAATAAAAARKFVPAMGAFLGEGPDGASLGGRIEFVLYAKEAPRAAENFRAMSTGEKGKGWTFVGMRFYRILDLFIDQAGAGPGSVWSGSFDDDPGGLALHHDRPGLLSAANSGPDTNSGHFSIVVAPAPHLDASYTIFGEVVSGMDVVMAINRLDKYVKGSATVQEAGCVSNCASLGVEPKCKHRAATSRNVQNRPMKPCVD